VVKSPVCTHFIFSGSRIFFCGKPNR